MKGIFTRFNLIVGLSALVLLTLCFVQLTVRAHQPQPKSPILRATTTGVNPTLLSDHRDGPLFPHSGISARLAPGQKLSVKLTNLIEIKGQGPVAIYARLHLRDSHAGLITQSEEVKIPFRGSYSFTFKRAALRLPGERGTGRLSILLNGWVRYEYRSHDRDSEDPYLFIRDGRATGLLPVSVHLINESNGQTITLYQDGQKKDKPATRLGKAGGSQLPSKERQPGLKEIQAERENETSQGNQAVTGRVTGVAIDPSAPMRPINKMTHPIQPDLMIKQFLFPPTNDKALRVHVVNQGNAASGACRLILTVRKINGTAVGRQAHVNIPALAPGKTVWLVFDGKGILPNNVSLQATTFKLNVDATEIVAESNEGNNEVWHNL